LHLTNNAKRATISFKPTEKLQQGIYTLAIYSEKDLIGNAQIRLLLFKQLKPKLGQTSIGNLEQALNDFRKSSQNIKKNDFLICRPAFPIGILNLPNQQMLI
jgi:hypothetical protein